MLLSPIAALWLSALLFAALHSLLASEAIKQRASRLLPERYRLFYSIVALLSLLLWLLFLHRLPDAPLYHVDGVAGGVLRGVQMLGMAIFLAAAHVVDLPLFLGLRAPPLAGEPLLERGIYRYLRHPMYSGGVLLLLATPEQSRLGLHFALAVTLYCMIGARLEERRMLRRHPAYADYRRRVFSGI